MSSKTNGSGPTLLEVVNEYIAVDCDTTNVEFVQTLPITCHDMTSNQRFIHDAIVDPKNKALVEKAVREGKGADWKDVYATIVSVSRLRLPFLCPVITSSTFPFMTRDNGGTIVEAELIIMVTGRSTRKEDAASYFRSCSRSDSAIQRI